MSSIADGSVASASSSSGMWKRGLVATIADGLVLKSTSSSSLSVNWKRGLVATIADDLVLKSTSSSSLSGMWKSETALGLASCSINDMIRRLVAFCSTICSVADGFVALSTSNGPDS